MELVLLVERPGLQDDEELQQDIAHSALNAERSLSQGLLLDLRGDRVQDFREEPRVHVRKAVRERLFNPKLGAARDGKPEVSQVVLVREFVAPAPPLHDDWARGAKEGFNTCFPQFQALASRLRVAMFHFW